MAVRGYRFTRAPHRRPEDVTGGPPEPGERPARAAPQPR